MNSYKNNAAIIIMSAVLMLMQGCNFAYVPKVREH